MSEPVSTLNLPGKADPMDASNLPPVSQSVDSVDAPVESKTAHIVNQNSLTESKTVSLEDAMRLYPLGDEPTYLAKCNPHSKDPYISLDEATHTYSVNFQESQSGTFTSEGVVSVSHLVKNCFPVFDPLKVIPKMKSNKRKWNPTHPLYNRTDTQIQAKWKADGVSASRKGTWLHGQLERIMNGTNISTLPYREIVELQQFSKWRTDFFDAKLVPFRTEFKLKSDIDLRLTGTIDLLAVEKDYHKKDTNVLELYMIDWKFSKQIKMSNPFGGGLAGTPCAHLDDCNYVHYSLQQNAYKWLFETFYSNWEWSGKKYTSVKIVSMQLVIFHENYGVSGEILDLVDLQDVIREMIDARKNNIHQSNPEPPSKLRKLCK